MIEWDGRDERGSLVPASTYFVRLRSASGEARLKLVRAQR
jgi:hypothetical protein